LILCWLVTENRRPNSKNSRWKNGNWTKLAQPKRMLLP
jgi:hypothetical protein